jgi:hypothetical protein
MINHYEEGAELTIMHDDFVPVHAQQLQSIIVLLEGPNDGREIAVQYLYTFMKLLALKRIVDNDA